MKKSLMMAAMLCGCLAWAEDPQIPDLANGKWEEARTAAAEAKFTLEEQDGKTALRVVQTNSEGYAFARTYVELAPGEYTLKFDVNGKSEKGMLIQCYSFNAEGKPSLIIFNAIPAEKFAPGTFYITFKVPANSVKLRLDLGLSNSQGDLVFTNPEILAGKVTKP